MRRSEQLLQVHVDETSVRHYHPRQILFNNLRPMYCTYTPDREDHTCARRPPSVSRRLWPPPAPCSCSRPAPGAPPPRPTPTAPSHPAPWPSARTSPIPHTLTWTARPRPAATRTSPA